MLKLVFLLGLVFEKFFGVFSSELFDKVLYESVLNSTLCQRHLRQMNLIEFYDAGFRIPQSFTLGDLASLGNYHQCLGIRQELSEDVIEGKYCMIQFSYHDKQNISILNYNKAIPLDKNETEVLNRAFIWFGKRMQQFVAGINDKTDNLRNGVSEDKLSKLSLDLALCIPKSCSTSDVIGSYLDVMNLTYQEMFCRLPSDKVFTVEDWIAVSIFSIIGILTLLSTCIDLHNIFLLKKEPREVSKLLRCFSVYTNTIRILTFTDPPGSISCLDGIRSISILWVVIGHSFANNSAGTIINNLDIVEWASSSKSLWLLSANLAVDTFFMMSGLLTVYTTASKTSQMSLVKNIHFFYLHRLLRMFPLLAAAVLLQGSLFHHFSDGPNWHNFATGVQSCRDWWWSALLHVQNYVNMSEICLAQSWYLSVDVQLHLVSPLLLFFALGGRRVAYGGLTIGLLLSITIAMVYCFCYNFDGISFVGMINNDMVRNFQKYYVNTLTRSPAFIVGMVFGHFLHLLRTTRVRFSTCSIVVIWMVAVLVGSSMIYLNDPGMVLSRFWINLFSAIMRPLWAFALGLMILACVQGYGGPINWFLSLTVWKFIARVSYSLYLFHYPVQIMLRSANTLPIYFSVGNLLQVFVVDLVYSLTLATVLCVLVDAPYSTLIKMVFERSTRMKNQSKTNGSSEILTQL